MIPVTVRIYVYREAVDMRRGFDGLALVAREAMGHDPRSGSVFIFANRRADKLKLLWWDRNGYCVLYKRLHGARFILPLPHDGSALSVRIEGKQLAELLAGAEREKKARSSRANLHLVR
jgi:transposase